MRQTPIYNIAKSLAGLLKPYTAKMDSFVKKTSFELVKVLDSLQLNQNDIFVSLDVVSLFTWVSIEPTTELLTPLFSTPVVKLFEYVIHSTYFVYDGNYYEQTDGIAMCSPL